MKQIRFLIIFIVVLFATTTTAQVGINTQDPKATFDIVANTTSPTANGLLIPRLTAEAVKSMTQANNPQLVGADQNSLLVYITQTFTVTPTNTKYTDITTEGYYYWDAKANSGNGKWKNFGEYLAGAGIEIKGNTVSATGLERKNVEDFYAWRLIGRNKPYGSDYPVCAPLGEGAVDLSLGNYSYHAMNKKTNKYELFPSGASGKFSVAIGDGVLASGYGSIAIGTNVQSNADLSTVIGIGSTIAEKARRSFLIGNHNTQEAGWSFLIGNESSISKRAEWSFALGNDNQINAYKSIALGNGIYVTGTATGATTLGSGLRVSEAYSTVVGYFNKDVKDARFIVGNGKANSYPTPPLKMLWLFIKMGI